MKDLLGTTFTGLIIDENDTHYFVQKNGLTFRLAKTEGEHKLGDTVDGFGYLNQKQALSMTTVIPQVRKDHFAFGEVTNVRRDLGVFVDVGLPDKDIVVSMDELPAMKELWPKKGDRLMVALRVDDKDRIWGTLADETLFRSMSRKGTEQMKNENKSGTVFRLKLAGTYLLTDDLYLGFVHPSERYQEPRLGEKINGRVIGVRPDGVLNMSLKPRSHEMINDDAAMILTLLERSEEKMLPYSDKSTPDEIKNTFGISKGQFKRALGHLMKEKLIRQENGKTFLVSKD